MIISRMGKNNQPVDSFVIPNQCTTGLEKYAEADPVMAKTINIIVS